MVKLNRCRTKLLLVATLIAGFSGNTVWGQSDRKGLHFASLGLTPQAAVVPGGTLVLQAVLANYDDQLREGTLVTYIAGFEAQQSARRVRMSGQGQEVLPIHIQLPAEIDGLEKIDIRATLYVEQGGREVVQDQAGEPAEHQLTLQTRNFPRKAALFLNPPPPQQTTWRWPPAPEYWSYEWVTAARVDAGLGRQGSSFDESTYPLDHADWSAFDMAVIADPAPLRDAAFVESLKTYVAGGGCAWVMLDKVDCSAIRPLLGADQLVEGVDSVTINEGVVEIRNDTYRLSAEDRQLDSDIPVLMKRVVQQGGEVSHSVDGWPLAIWMPYGSGEVLLTTMEAAGWLERREKQQKELLMRSSFKSRMWASGVARRLNRGEYSLPLTQAVEYPVRHIGNPIVPRTWVALSLGGFCVLLVALVGWRCWLGDLMAIGWWSPALALAVSLVITSVAIYSRRDIAESVARFQWVQISDDGQSAIVGEQSAGYLTQQREMSLESSVAGRAWASGEISGGVRRFQMLDFQHWRLTSPVWPPSVWRYRSEYRLPSDSTIVRGELNERGLELQVPEEFAGQLADSVLAYTAGNAMICRPAEARLFADGRLRGSGDRWIADSILDAEQRRRLEVYRELFTPVERTRPLDRKLFAWTHLWEQGPSWDHDLETRGAALVALPVILRRPEVGEDIYIPFGLVQLQYVPDQLGESTAFHAVTGKWIDESTIATTIRLQFVLPDELVPFEADELDLELDVRAPFRRVTLSLSSGEEEMRQIVELDSPSLPWSTTIRDPDILGALSDGVLEVTLDVSDRTDLEDSQSVTNVVAWSVNHMQLSARGAVGPAVRLASDTEAP